MSVVVAGTGETRIVLRMPVRGAGDRKHRLSIDSVIGDLCLAGSRAIDNDLVMKKITKRPPPKASHLQLDHDKLQHARGGDSTLGKVVMDSNILPT